MTAGTRIDELALLRTFAHCSVRTETRLAELRGARLAGRAMAHREYVGERDERDSLLQLWRRLFGNAQLLTGARASATAETRSSEFPARPPAA